MRLIAALKRRLYPRLRPNATLHAAFARAPDALVLADERGRIMAVSDAACHMWGYTREELLAQNLNMLMPVHLDAEPNSRPGNDAQGDVLDGRPGARRELCARRRDGSEFMVEVALSSTHIDGRCMFIAVLRDISERKRLEDLLKAERDRFAQGMDTVDAMIVSLDRAGDITFANPKAAQLLGRHSEELIGCNWYAACMPAPEAEVLAEEHRQAMAGKSYYLEQFEGRIVSRRGERRIIAFHNRLLARATGAVDGLLICGQDVSAHRELETRHRRAQAQMQAAQRVHCLGRLAGGIAHEFNNILTTIIGYSQLAHMMPTIQNDADLSRYITEIVGAGERARKLVSRMHAFSHGDKDEPPAPLDVAEAVNRLLPILEAAMPSTMEVHADIARDLPPAMFPCSELEQVIMNLFLNARDALRNRGRIELSLSLARTAGICSSCQRSFEGEYIRLRVRDAGAGIEPRDLPRIFEPFFTTTDSGRGVGLGLSVVHAMVHARRGHIQVDSTPGSGTVVDVYLAPHWRERAQTAFSRIQGTAGADTRTGDLLLVEPCTARASPLIEALAGSGYRVHRFRDGEAALAAFQAAPESFSVLITAQSLAGLTGMELAGAALALRPQLRVILTSDAEDSVDEALLHECGIAHLPASQNKHAMLRVLGSTG